MARMQMETTWAVLGQRRRYSTQLMMRIRFKIRTLLAIVTLIGVTTGLASRWYSRSTRQFNAIIELTTPRDTGRSEFNYPNFSYLPDYKVFLDETGRYQLVSPIPQCPQGFPRFLTRFLDERTVCNATAIYFESSPSDHEIELVKKLKGVEQITIQWCDEAALTRLRVVFPNARIEGWGNGFDWAKLTPVFSNAE